MTFAKIGLFTFGGGYAMLSIIEDICVEKKNWITHDEMMNITVIAESTPGPIAINCATYVGYTVGGIWGSVLATLAIVLPSLIIMLSICKAYFRLSKRFKGNPYFEQTLRMLRFAVIGLIASAALLLIKPTNFIDSTSWIIFSVVAFLTVLPNFIKKKEGNKLSTFNFQLSTLLSHPILLIVLSGLAGYLIYG